MFYKIKNKKDYYKYTIKELDEILADTFENYEASSEIEKCRKRVDLYDNLYNEFEYESMREYAISLMNEETHN